MKTIRKLSLMLLSMLFMSNLAFSQYKIIVKSKTSIKQLQIKNTITGAISNIPTWNKTGGGFLLVVADLEKTEIVASAFMEIQLYRIDNKESATWVQMNSGQKLTIGDCFDIYGTTATSNGEDLANVSEFFTSVFTGYSVSGTNMVVRGGSKIEFHEPKSNFFDADEISFAWKAKSEVEKINLKDLTTNKLVWTARAGFTESKIDYKLIANDLGEKAGELLKVGNEYELQFFVKGEKDAITKKFNITPAYYNMASSNSFLSWENLIVTWQSQQKISYAWIEDLEGNAVWEAENLENNKIDFVYLQKSMEIFEAGKYKLILEYNKLQVPFEFEIFASPEEVEELKGFLVE